MMDSGSGRWGIAKVRRVFPLVDPRAASAPESRVRVACVLAGLSPIPQYEVLIDGIELHVDLAFPDIRLAIEYEGEYHFEETQIVRDDRRYALLVAAGWRVIRLSSADLRNLDAVVERIRTELDRAF
jgi:hypothetical protein